MGGAIERARVARGGRWPDGLRGQAGRLVRTAGDPDTIEHPNPPPATTIPGRIRNPPASWGRADNAFEPIVDPIIFEAARQIILARSYRLTDADMLDALRKLLLRNGYLSGIIIDESPGCPSSSAYASRLGSLLRTYDLIGQPHNRAGMRPSAAATTMAASRSRGINHQGSITCQVWICLAHISPIAFIADRQYARYAART